MTLSTSTLHGHDAEHDRGSVRLQYDAIKSSAGWRAFDDRLIVRVSGDDRVSFLHGMCTADIKGLRTGEAARALFVTEHAHVLAEFFVYALETAFLLEIDRQVWTTIRTHLEQFLVADDVEMDELESLRVIDLEGPQAGTIAALSGGSTNELAPWRVHPESLIAHLPRFGSTAFTMLVEQDAVPELLTRLRSLTGLVELEAATLEIIRIENGLAQVGIDTTAKTLALEARLELAIAFSKGCYIGQETIERATARGALKRRLCGLRIEGSQLPGAGSVISLEGKPVGALTSLADSPACGLIGLAIMHHSAWPKGTRVLLDNGVAAFTAELPFINS